MFCTPHPLYLLALIHWEIPFQCPYVLLSLDWCSSITLHTAYSILVSVLIQLCGCSSILSNTPPCRFGLCLSHCALLQQHFCTPLFHTQLPVRCFSFPGSCFPLSSEYMILPFKSSFRLAASYHLITLWIEITHCAQQHWNSMSSTHQIQIISRFNE